ncbi:MAG: hypothetical protein IKP61_04110 [Spirochaetales bacterium]|nr:hypothetical protein [Spirochaetales bacterium]
MKTGRVILMMTILLALCFSAFAESFNVLVYPANNEIERYLSELIARVSSDAEKRGIVLNRLEEEQERLLGGELAEAYRSEDENKVTEVREAYLNRSVTLEEGDLELNILDSGEFSFDERAMATGDIALLDMVCRSSQADMLIMPVISDIQDFRYLRLYIYQRGSDSAQMVYEELVSRQSVRFPIACSMKLGQALCNESMALLHLESMVDGSEVLVDGKKVNVVDSCIICTEGKHTVSISATGYREKTIGIELTADAESSADAGLQAILFSGLEIESDPVADILIGGLPVGKTPLLVETYSVPSSVRLMHEGYSDAVIGLTGKTDSISVSLKPSWMADKAILKENKDDFYAAFARSLLIFGAKVFTRTMNDGDNKFMSVLDIAAGGALTVSIVDMVGRLIDYYRQTEYISP